MSMMKKLTDLANSQKGRELADKATTKAKQLANDPETRQKIDAAKKKFNERVGGGGDRPGSGAGTTAAEGTAGGPGPTAADGTAGGPDTTAAGGTSGGPATTPAPADGDGKAA